MRIEDFREGDEETRTRGVLKLLPHWLYRNRFWHLDIIRWLKTPKGENVFADMFVAAETITFLGRLELEGGPVSGVDYVSKALPIAKKMGYDTEGREGRQLRKRMQENLLGSMRLGYVIKEGDNIMLSGEARQLFAVTEALRSIVEREEKQGNN